jgi:putative aminopeptidase FrvX
LDMVELLKELIYIPGISGYEDDVRKWIRKYIEDAGGIAKITEDNLGNLIVNLNDDKDRKTVVVMAHMDEIGMVVAKIEDDGSLRIRKVGGIDDRILVGRMVETKTSKGIVPGVIGLIPPHLITDKTEMKSTIPADELYVDICTRTRAETESLGVRPLDPIVLKKDFLIMNGKYISARGLDDRAGCVVLLDLYKRIKDLKLKINVQLVFSVQEETGLRGAYAIAHTMKPDYIIPVDSMSTNDGPGLPKKFEPMLLGSGPVLRFMDNRAIASPKLRDFFLKLVKEKNLPLQLGISGGTTDGAAVQESGAAMMPLCIPVRYTHSPVEVIHVDDLVNLSKLLTEAVKKL